MYTIGICDDDPVYRAAVIKYICEMQDIGGKAEIYEYGSGQELLDDIEKMHDLIFLDIQMPGIDGNKTARLLRERNQQAVLVFCTNYYNPTPETFKVQPFRYIIKDLQDRMLKEDMEAIIREMGRRTEISYLTVHTGEGITKIPVREILYISILKRGAEIHLWNMTKHEELVCREKVRDLYYMLKPQGFEYAHSSYLVNLEHVVRCSQSALVLKDHTELSISRSRRIQFEKSFIDFLCFMKN
ncbi:LytTR family DNA-binding domain-containing protein [Lachnospiraceae bacterium 54-53]